ncbi:hypothetical protein S245_004726, partial [Arachis hypogaea]
AHSLNTLETSIGGASQLPDVFKDLVVAVESIREAVAKQLVIRLKVVQSAYDVLDKKEAKKGDDELDDCAPSIRYTVHKLIHGVSSLRIGFEFNMKVYRCLLIEMRTVNTLVIPDLGPDNGEASTSGTKNKLEIAKLEERRDYEIHMLEYCKPGTSTNRTITILEEDKLKEHSNKGYNFIHRINT